MLPGFLNVPAIFSADVNRVSPVLVLCVALEGHKTCHENTPVHP